MKIISENGLSNGVEVLDDNGENLLRSLSINSIRVIFEVGEPVKAILEVSNVEVDSIVDKENVVLDK